MKHTKYKVTVLTLYLGLFVMHGINLAILGQYKEQLAQLWNCNIADVLSLISILNLGSLVFTIFNGPITDKVGRKIPLIFGDICMAVYYFALTLMPSISAAKMMAFIFYGLGDTFSYVAGSAVIIEAFPDKSSSANVMTKFLISLGQFILPIFILLVSLTHSNFRVLFIAGGIVYLVVSVILSFSKFPPMVKKQKTKSKAKIHFNLGGLALILIGYTSCATFNLWTNTYQEFAKSCGITQPSILISIYAVGGALSVLLTSFLVGKGVKESLILTVYPFLAALSLLFEIVIPQAWIMYIVAFLFGVFAAGGLYQLCTALLTKIMPNYKATAISIAQFMSFIGNASIVYFASLIEQNNPGIAGYRGTVFLNILVAFIGGVLGLITMYEERKLAK